MGVVEHLPNLGISFRSGVSQPGQHNSGWSKAPNKRSSQPAFSSSSPDQVDAEKQAVVLINQGKLQEAEIIYRQLIKKGSVNHTIYCNLATICGAQGKLDELIELLR